MNADKKSACSELQQAGVVLPFHRTFDAYHMEKESQDEGNVLVLFAE